MRSLNNPATLQPSHSRTSLLRPTRPTPHHHARLATRLAITILLPSATACRDALVPLGPTHAEARANAADLLRALELRFGVIQLDPALAAARLKFARSALTPSRIYGDTVLWTGANDSTRTLGVGSTTLGGRYGLAVRAATSLREPGDYRRNLQLRRLTPDVYEWRARDELALGSVRTSELRAMLGAAFRALEANGEPALRVMYREGFPRTTQAMGRLFTLDSLRTTPDAGGGAEVRLVVTLHTKRLAATYPNYAKYLEKYLSPAAFGLSLTDSTNARWAEVRAGRERLTVRFRVADGALVPLTGPPRAVPATLRTRLDVIAKAGIFRVGMRGLVGDVALTREAHDLGFTARFRKEPDWILPPLVEQMINSPLKRPFAGDGVTLTYAIRDSAGAPTVSDRSYRLVVQESAVLRFLGKLGNSALSDFRAGAEREADLFAAELWRAMRADAQTVELPATAGQ